MNIPIVRPPSIAPGRRSTLRRLADALDDDSGSVTAEYAIATMATVVAIRLIY